jgi:FtsZ-binding cell division protein ZapB
MKLTDEAIKRIRRNKYSVDCIQGICALSDGDIIANLCDTIEALQQENERLKDDLNAFTHIEQCRAFAGLATTVGDLQQENERLKQAVEVYHDTAKTWEAGYEKLKQENERLKAQTARTIELPCKVGDTVYIIRKQRNSHGTHDTVIKTAEVTNISSEGTSHIWITADGYNWRADYYLSKTVFLTREAAEKALAEVGNG